MQWRNASKEKGQSSKAWKACFEASLKFEQLGPPVLEFTDLRGDLVGSVTTWTESVKCLLCGTTIT